jgi:hypothetical protein
MTDENHETDSVRIAVAPGEIGSEDFLNASINQKRYLLSQFVVRIAVAPGEIGSEDFLNASINQKRYLLSQFVRSVTVLLLRVLTLSARHTVHPT